MADTDVEDAGVAEGEAEGTPQGENVETDEPSLFEELSKVFEDTEGEGGTDSEVSDGEPVSGGADDSQVFTVKVDGEEVEVPLDELVAGYSRQADYTKKTQVLAAERERLQGLEQLAEALESNPKVALEELANALGVQLVPETISDDEEFLDPVEAQVRELQKQIEGLTGKLSERELVEKQAQEDAALQAELDQIKRANEDPNLDEEALLRFAIDNKINDLSVAYKFMRLDVGSQAAASQGDTALNAKRNMPPVERGAGRRNAKTGGKKIMSISDALQAALQDSSA